MEGRCLSRIRTDISCFNPTLHAICDQALLATRSHFLPSTQLNAIALSPLNPTQTRSALLLPPSFANPLLATRSHFLCSTQLKRDRTLSPRYPGNRRIVFTFSYFYVIVPWATSVTPSVATGSITVVRSLLLFFLIVSCVVSRLFSASPENSLTLLSLQLLRLAGHYQFAPLVLSVLS